MQKLQVLTISLLTFITASATTSAGPFPELSPSQLARIAQLFGETPTARRVTQLLKRVRAAERESHLSEFARAKNRLRGGGERASTWEEAYDRAMKRLQDAAERSTAELNAAARVGSAVKRSGWRTSGHVRAGTEVPGAPELSRFEVAQVASLRGLSGAQKQALRESLELLPLDDRTLILRRLRGLDPRAPGFDATMAEQIQLIEKRAALNRQLLERARKPAPGAKEVAPVEPNVRASSVRYEDIPELPETPGFIDAKTHAAFFSLPGAEAMTEGEVVAGEVFRALEMRIFDLPVWYRPEFEKRLNLIRTWFFNVLSDYRHNWPELMSDMEGRLFYERMVRQTDRLVRDVQNMRGRH